MNNSQSAKEVSLSHKWLVLLNPHAGAGKGKQDQKKILKILQSKNLEYDLVRTDYPGHAIELTRDKIIKGYRRLIAAGGDGTLNEMVNGILLQDQVNPEKILIGMIPVGTGNDWIRTFGIPDDYKKAVDLILDQKKIQQDIGVVEFREQNRRYERYFVNAAGFGFDAMVVRKVNRLKDKGKKGAIIYLQSLLGTFFSYKTNKYRIRIDDQDLDEQIFSISVGIGKFSGGGMMQTPDAVPTSGEFQITVIRKISFLRVLRNIFRLYTGEFIKDSHVSVFKGKKILIGAQREIAGEVDGETLGNHVFKISVHQKKINVIFGDDKYLAQKKEHKTLKLNN